MNIKHISVIIFFALLVFSCKPKQNMVYMQKSDTNYKEQVEQAKFAGLHIQQGDVLQIVVSAFDEIAARPFNLDTMNKTGTANNQTSSEIKPSEYVVSADGTINFPVLGVISCKGLTKNELTTNLEQRLKKYLTDPMVKVKLANFNVSILGEVKNPGQKTSPTEKLNVFQALALGGDMTDNADRTKVKLIRSNENSNDEVIVLDFSKSDIVNSPYYYLQQNDILYIEPDENKQIAANNNPNRNLWFQIGGIGIAIVTLIISLTRK